MARKCQGCKGTSRKRCAKRAPKGYRWICKRRVRHYISGKLMERKDGKPFRFLVRCK